MTQSMMSPLTTVLEQSLLEFRLTNNVSPTFHIFHESQEEVDIYKLDKITQSDNDVAIFKAQMIDKIKGDKSIDMVLYVDRTKISSPHIDSNEIILAQGFVAGWKESLALPIDSSCHIVDEIRRIDFIDHELDEVFNKIPEV